MDSGPYHLHLVSDATGETLASVARACLVQFEQVKVTTHLWSLVRTSAQMQRTIDAVATNPGMVLATLVDADLRDLLDDGCRRLHVPFVPLLDPVMAALAGFLNVGFDNQPGRQHVLDANYFRRIDAMDFALEHDDGQLVYDLENADVVLVGVSRTSKTPTAMYLANRGIKAANIPLVPDIPPPEELATLKHPLVVGLTRDPRGLADIRQTRITLLDPSGRSTYADYDHVRAELANALRLFARHDWPVIDVSHRSIEEAAATILQLLSRRRGDSGEGL